MRSEIDLAKVVDREIADRFLAALRKGGGEQGLMIRELADAADVSLTTAGKYVDVLQARGLVDVRPFATAKLVKLTAAGRSEAKSG